MDEERVVMMMGVRRYLRAKDMNMAGEVADALNDAVLGLLDVAIHNARGDKINTVKARHIPSARSISGEE